MKLPKILAHRITLRLAGAGTPEYLAFRGQWRQSPQGFLPRAYEGLGQSQAAEEALKKEQALEETEILEREKALRSKELIPSPMPPSQESMNQLESRSPATKGRILPGIEVF